MKAQTKAIVASLVVVTFCLSTVGGVTYSWFTDTERANIDVNTATVKYDLLIDENDLDTDAFPPFVDIVGDAGAYVINVTGLVANDRVSIPYTLTNSSTIETYYKISFGLTSESNVYAGEDVNNLEELDFSITYDGTTYSKSYHDINGTINSNNEAIPIVWGTNPAKSEPKTGQIVIETSKFFTNSQDDPYNGTAGQFGLIVKVEAYQSDAEGVRVTTDTTMTGDSTNGYSTTTTVSSDQGPIVVNIKADAGSSFQNGDVVSITALPGNTYGSPLAFQMENSGADNNLNSTVELDLSGTNYDVTEIANIAHISDDGSSVDLIDVIQIGNGKISFKIDSFSYFLVWGDEFKLNISAFDDIAGVLLVKAQAASIPTVVSSDIVLSENLELGADLILNADLTLEDANVIVEDKVRIILNGTTLAATEATVLVDNGGELSVEGSGTIKEIEPNYGAILVRGTSDTATASSLVVSGAIALQGWSGVAVGITSAPYGTGNNISTDIELDGVTINSVLDMTDGKGYGIYVNGTDLPGTNDIEIDIIESKISSAGHGIGSMGLADWTITDCDVNGAETGIEIRAGTMTIGGETIVNGGIMETCCTPEDSGTTTVGAAIAVSQHTTELPITLTINDGTFQAYTALYEKDTVPISDTPGTVSITLNGGEFISTEGAAGIAIEIVTNVDGFDMDLDTVAHVGQIICGDALMIGTVEELQQVAENVNNGETYSGRTLNLIDDLDLDGIDWTPIGNRDHPFMGSFNGYKDETTNFTISNLSVSGENYLGLFGYVDGKYGSRAIISNLNIDNVRIDGSGYIGAATGYAFSNATLSNISVTDAILTGNHYIGGIVGQAYAAIDNCQVSTISITATPNWVSSNNCYDNGDKIGGIFGQVQGDASNPITNNYAEDVTLHAYRDAGIIAGCAPGNLVSGSSVSGMNEVILDPFTYHYGFEGLTAGSEIGRNCSNMDKPRDIDGSSTFNKVVKIGSKDAMFLFAQYVNENGASFDGFEVRLTTHIDLANEKWTPIGQTGGTQFMGTFNGNHFTISGLNIDTTDDRDDPNYSTGLFGWLNNGVVKNLVIDGAQIKGNKRVGAIAGYMELGSTIQDCKVRNSVISGIHHSSSISDASNGNLPHTPTDTWDCGDKVGSIVGYMNSIDMVLNCHAYNVKINAARDAGQIVGAGQTLRVLGCTADAVEVSSNTTECKGGNINNSIIGRILGTGTLDLDTAYDHVDHLIVGGADLGASDKGLSVPEGDKSLTLDDTKLDVKGWEPVISVGEGSSLTLGGDDTTLSGNDRLINTSEGSKVTINDGSYDCSAIIWTDYCTNLRINGGNFDINAVVISDNPSYDILITGGTFDISAGFTAGQLVPSGCTFVITGGSFNIDPTEYVDTTRYSVANTGGMYIVTANDGQ